MSYIRARPGINGENGIEHTHTHKREERKCAREGERMESRKTQQRTKSQAKKKRKEDGTVPVRFLAASLSRGCRVRCLLLVCFFCFGHLFLLQTRLRHNGACTNVPFQRSSEKRRVFSSASVMSCAEQYKTNKTRDGGWGEWEHIGGKEKEVRFQGERFVSHSGRNVLSGKGFRL